MPPRRRAFRSNNFGLEPTTIPRDAKRQAEPPSRKGAHSRQNHFHFNPSRRLVETHIRFAASNAHPRLNVLPHRDYPAHAPHFYRAFAPAGAMWHLTNRLPFAPGRRNTSWQDTPAVRLSSNAPSSPRLHNVSSGVIEILSLRDYSRKIIVFYFNQAFAPAGAAQGKLLTMNYYLYCPGGTFSQKPHTSDEGTQWGGMTTPTPSRGAGVGIQDA